MDINMCFVIQPFDDGKFDKRYRETFVPAIRNANLDPYRVDMDYGSQIPIEDIDAKLKKSAIVLADITLDNPNVWFEVGLAIAYQKRIVLVCSSERVGKYPFDIQHRSVLKYTNDGKGDFEKLELSISEKLKKLMSKKNLTTKPESEIGIISEKEISDEALNLIGVLGNQIESFDGSVLYGKAVSEMASIGYNNLALNLAINELKIKEFILICEETDNNYNPYRVIKITELGVNWLSSNKTRFNLSQLPKEEVPSSKESDSFEIPF